MSSPAPTRAVPPPAPTSAWPAPAKLNLFLHITGRRADGYHLLQTAFQFLDYGDELHFHPRPDGVISLRASYPGIDPERDLIVRAARLLGAESGATNGADIEVRKHLPMGGGLGGGSSDAATTLVALNHLWGTGLEPERLAALGLSLGADVPVFVHGRAAWAEGVGEVLTPIEPPQPWFAVLSPGVTVATAEIFHAPDLTRNTPAITIRDFIAGAGGNDCERTVRRACPQVAEALDWLGQRATARLTGTGSCVFAAFGSKPEADAIIRQLPAPWNGFVARGLNRSPLLDRLERETG